MYTRRILFGIVFILISVNISYSQSGWVWQNPVPLGNLEGIKCKFLNEYTGWIYGNRFVAKTTNAGVNWKFQLIDNNISVTSFYILNENTLFAISGDKNIIKSTNSGENWTGVDISAPNILSDVIFINELTGFLTSNSSTLFKSTNGGTNWVELTTPASSYLDWMKFFTPNSGLISSVGRIYKTINGGINWSSIYLSSSTSLPDFPDSLTGYVRVSNGISKTTNGGYNWTTVLSNVDFVTDIEFINPQTGFVINLYNQLFKTTNGGNNWSSYGMPVTDGYKCISMGSSSTGYATADLGIINKTTNGGVNWFRNQNSVIGGVLLGVSSVNQNYSYICTQSNYILKTSNGGTLWQLISLSSNLALTSIFFVNENTGWSTSQVNPVLKTTNAGITWVNQTSPQPLETSFYKVFFLNENTGWAAGFDCILRTTNGGAQWVNGLSGTSRHFRKLSFGDADNGWAIAHTQLTDTLFRTTNGGISWFAPSLPFIETNDVFFINNNTGWISSRGVIHKTTDNGSSWTDYIPLSNEYLVTNNIKFINPQTGFAIGYYSSSDQRIIKTTNGGVNWIETTITCSSLTSIDMVNENTGWVVGDYGSILKTTTGGNVFISQTSTEIPERFSLHQNYPNPFNPTTNIKFDIHKQGIATLKVFDLLGKEMETLVDEQLSVGSYEVIFNANSLPSGIYFYVLKTGDFVESKKMILVK